MLHNRPYNDNKSEMWSVGCIFYEMLSGKPLFSTVKSISELRAAVNQNPREYIKFPPGKYPRPTLKLYFPNHFQHKFTFEIPLIEIMF